MLLYVYANLYTYCTKNTMDLNNHYSSLTGDERKELETLRIQDEREELEDLRIQVKKLKRYVDSLQSTLKKSTDSIVSLEWELTHKERILQAAQEQKDRRLAKVLYSQQAEDEFETLKNEKANDYWKVNARLVGCSLPQCAKHATWMCPKSKKVFCSGQCRASYEHKFV